MRRDFLRRHRRNEINGAHRGERGRDAAVEGAGQTFASPLGRS